jgi:hypothetical protein
LIIVKPETVIRWHRQGFKLYWRWKSKAPVGRPKIDKEIRELIRKMSRENPVLRQNLVTIDIVDFLRPSATLYRYEGITILAVLLFQSLTQRAMQFGS